MIQATGRDVFSEAVLRLEDAGYIPVLSIHDEIVLEVPTGTDPQTIENIMAEPVPWLPGLTSELKQKSYSATKNDRISSFYLTVADLCCPLAYR
jgi:hypothetical protein